MEGGESGGQELVGAEPSLEGAGMANDAFLAAGEREESSSSSADSEELEADDEGAKMLAEGTSLFRDQDGLPLAKEQTETEERGANASAVEDHDQRIYALNATIHSGGDQDGPSSTERSAEQPPRNAV